jgi:hypothetical protein
MRTFLAAIMTTAPASAAVAYVSAQHPRYLRQEYIAYNSTTHTRNHSHHHGDEWVHFELQGFLRTRNRKKRQSRRIHPHHRPLRNPRQYAVQKENAPPCGHGHVSPIRNEGGGISPIRRSRMMSPPNAVAQASTIKPRKS